MYQFALTFANVKFRRELASQYRTPSLNSDCVINVCLATVGLTLAQHSVASIKKTVGKEMC